MGGSEQLCVRAQGELMSPVEAGVLFLMIIFATYLDPDDSAYHLPERRSVIVPRLAALTASIQLYCD